MIFGFLEQVKELFQTLPNPGLMWAESEMQSGITTDESERRRSRVTHRLR